MFKYIVNYEKVFVDGLLKGHRYTNDYIKFCDWHSADNFVKQCDHKTIVVCCAGSGSYIREYPILTALE